MVCAWNSVIPIFVTSLAEVWIEINTLDFKDYEIIVTSLAEVWIEITT